jgi:hypothetical protein
MHALSEHLETCLVVFVAVTPDWSLSQLSHADDWVRREIRDSIGLGKFIVPLFLDGAAAADPNTLPDDLREFANRQGYFVDSRSDGLFRAAMKVISDDIANRCPSALIWQRPDITWRQGIERNSWRVAVDGSPTLELNGSDTRGACIVPAGTRSLMVNWSEREYDRHYGQATSFGYHSWGETPPLRIDLRPGKYTLTLRTQPPTKKRNWFLRFLDGMTSIDRDPRVIEVVSFDAASHID